MAENINKRRIPINALIAPETKQTLKELADKFKTSQGHVIDDAVLLMKSTLDKPVEVSPVEVGAKRSKREKAVEVLAASDLTAQAVGRTDIEYGSHEEAPRGQHVANIANQQNSTGAWREGRKPILKPKDRR